MSQQHRTTQVFVGAASYQNVGLKGEGLKLLVSDGLW